MSRRIEVSSARGIAPRIGLTLDGEDVLRVRRVRGTTVTVVRWRWYHSRLDRLRRQARDAAAAVSAWLEGRLCALRGHPLGGDGYCRCGARENPDWLDEWELE